MCAKQTPIKSTLSSSSDLYPVEEQPETYGIGGKSVALASRKLRGFVPTDSASRSNVERMVDKRSHHGGGAEDSDKYQFSN